ncbi:MAG: DHH family phosphoesterase [bacterium]
MIKVLDELITPEVKTVAIAGHVRPDGDCFGSTTAVWSYLTKNFPELFVTLYLESVQPEFGFLPGIASARSEVSEPTPVDLLITCDVSTVERIGAAGPLFEVAKRRVCFDHHISNPGFADENYIFPDASSCAEVIFHFIPYEKLDRDTASAIYTGIVHDTGVFQQTNTGAETFEIAAKLLRKEVPGAWIVDKSVNERTYAKLRLMGEAFIRSKQYFNGLAIMSHICLSDFEKYGCVTADSQGIVAELRKTTGAEVAVFAYEVEPNSYRVSFRSCDYLNVSDVAAKFGGGGHVRASGCSVYGAVEEVYEQVLAVLGEALENNQ